MADSNTPGSGLNILQKIQNKIGVLSTKTKKTKRAINLRVVSDLIRKFKFRNFKLFRYFLLKGLFFDLVSKYFPCLTLAQCDPRWRRDGGGIGTWKIKSEIFAKMCGLLRSQFHY